MADSKRLNLRGTEGNEAVAAQKAAQRGASRRGKPERFSISSRAKDVAGLYRDIEAASDKVAANRYGVHGVRLGVQLVLPGHEWLVDGFEAYIGHREDPSLSEVVVIVVNHDRGQGKPRRNGQERLAA